ncbi:MAG: SDR family oxidoreductase [Proteobacteria bacterium]|nr:SDR family oxidoreductase [Pseudomonadota bacterium]
MSALPAAYALTGRTALITGAAGLLGAEHAAALLETGADVVLTDVDSGRLHSVRARLGEVYDPARITMRTMDVTSPESIAAVRGDPTSPAIDILVNNAAIDAKVGPDGGEQLTRLERFPLDAWNLELAVGLTGAFLCAQAFGSAMAERGRGVILNIASDLSVIAPDQRLYRQDGRAETDQPVKPVTYSVVKTGLIGLTRYLAGYWAHRGVRANALSPGGILVAQDEAFVARLSALVPMGRMAECGEYRAAVQFLCSDASRYMTGQNVVIDGGRTVL